MVGWWVGGCVGAWVEITNGMDMDMDMDMERYVDTYVATSLQPERLTTPIVPFWHYSLPRHPRDLRPHPPTVPTVEI